VPRQASMRPCVRPLLASNLDQNLQLTPKGPMSVDGFLGSLGRLSRHQKHERSAEILKAGGPM
jgi:hypothetical protein